MTTLEWAEVDRATRERAIDALTRAGLDMVALDLRLADPLRCEVSALKLCHLALALADKLRGPIFTIAQRMMVSVSLAAWAAHRGKADSLKAHSADIEHLAARLAPSCSDSTEGQAVS